MSSTFKDSRSTSLGHNRQVDEALLQREEDELNAPRSPPHIYGRTETGIFTACALKEHAARQLLLTYEK